MLEPARKLKANDHTEIFDCGQESLNAWLHRFAWMSQRAGAARTRVVCDSGRIAGFYTLSVGSVEPDHSPDRVRKGLARHPVPVMLVARLAVDRDYQRRGLGRALLKDALLRTRQAADIAGIRAVLVHAKDAAARDWYRSWDFEPSPTDPFHLFLLLKDFRHL